MKMFLSINYPLKNVDNMKKTAIIKKNQCNFNNNVPQSHIYTFALYNIYTETVLNIRYFRLFTFFKE